MSDFYKTGSAATVMVVLDEQGRPYDSQIRLHHSLCPGCSVNYRLLRGGLRPDASVSA